MTVSFFAKVESDLDLNVSNANAVEILRMAGKDTTELVGIMELNDAQFLALALFVKAESAMSDSDASRYRFYAKRLVEVIQEARALGKDYIAYG